MQHLVDADLIVGAPSLTMTYNDFDLTISIHYQGALLSLPSVGIRKHFFLEARAAGENAAIRLIFSG